MLVFPWWRLLYICCLISCIFSISYNGKLVGAILIIRYSQVFNFVNITLTANISKLNPPRIKVTIQYHLLNTLLIFYISMVLWLMFYLTQEVVTAAVQTSPYIQSHLTKQKQWLMVSVFLYNAMVIMQLCWLIIILIKMTRFS